MAISIGALEALLFLNPYIGFDFGSLVQCLKTFLAKSLKV